MSRFARVAGWILAGSALVACVAFGASRAPETYPWGDTATTSLSTLQATRTLMPVGAYSRFGWHHPGPLMYQALAPFYWLSGYHEASLKWAALLINVASLAALVAIAWKRDPTLPVCVAVTLGVLLWREPRLLFSTWNPLLPVLPLLLLFVVAAAVAAGSIHLLPLLVVLASFAVQAHVGYGPVAAAVGAVTLILYVAFGARGLTRVGFRALRRNAVLGLVLGALVWALPIAEQLTGSPGNLTKLATFFSERGDGYSLAQAIAVFTRQLPAVLLPAYSPVLESLVVPLTIDWLRLSMSMVIAAGLVAAAAFALRRRNLFACALCVVCLAASAAAVWSIRSVNGPMSDYLVFWVVALGVISAAPVEWMLISITLRDARLSRLPPAWSAAVLAVFVAWSAVLGGVRAQGKQRSDAKDATVRALAVELHDYCVRNKVDRPVLEYTSGAWQQGVGVVLHFYKRRQPIAVPAHEIYRVGDIFAAEPSDTAHFFMMLMTEPLPERVRRFEWVTTRHGCRIVRLLDRPADSTD